MKTEHANNRLTAGRIAVALFGCFGLLFLAIGCARGPQPGPPFQATGFKTGEVTDTSAIVWTRLTLRPKRNPSDRPMVKIVYERTTSADDKKKGQNRRRVLKAVEYPEGITVADIRNAAPGADGQVRVLYRPKNSDAGWTETAWGDVDPDRDFTRQFRLTRLQPDTEYEVRVECWKAGGQPPGPSLEGGFHTAPPSEKPSRVVFTVSTGQGYNSRDSRDGYKIYPQMLKLRPSFFVHTGDIVYYDRLAKNIDLARYHWQRTYSLPSNVAFHRQVASYFIKDDHDTLMNDCWPAMKTRYMGDFTFEQGKAVFLEQVPMGERTWRTVRWGKDLQIWMVEGRDFRSANPDPDGPEKTIWGAEQKAWFKRTVRDSDATFRVLISPTPLVGPDRTNKHDNHSNRDFAHEGNELRRFIASQQNMVVCCGDRHWQYVSVDPATGLREYSCGPVSDKHAGGWKQSDYREEYHKYLNVVGGFLAGTVERIDGKPTLTFRHYSVDGKVLNEDRLTAE